MIDRKITMNNNSTTTSTTTTTTTTCSHCRHTNLKILHHIRLTGTFRRLCTTCVLRLHPKHFCPVCLTVYHPLPPDHAVVCHKCHSSSHPTCLSPPFSGRNPCATCLNPNGIVFDAKLINRNNNINQKIDLYAARLLVAAAEISLMSVGKAEAAAVTEADWRAKEAVEWRKKAKDAVNYVMMVMEIEKKKRGDDYRGVIDDRNSLIEVPEGLNAVKLEVESMCRMMKI